MASSEDSFSDCDLNHSYKNLKIFLDNLSLGEYFDKFKDNGYNDENYDLIREEDIENFIYKVGHRRQIIEAMKTLKETAISQCIIETPVIQLSDGVQTTYKLSIGMKEGNQSEQSLRYGFKEDNEKYGQRKQWPSLEGFPFPSIASSIEDKLKTGESLNLIEERKILNTIFDFMFEYFNINAPIFELEFICYYLISKYPSLRKGANDVYEWLLTRLRNKYRNYRFHSKQYSGEKVKVKKKKTKHTNDSQEVSIIDDNNFSNTDTFIETETTIQSEIHERASKRKSSIDINFIKKSKQKASNLISEQIENIGDHTNLKKLIKENPDLKTIKGFECELQANMAVNNYDIYDKNNEYFTKFTTNGKIVFERLSRISKYKNISIKYTTITGLTDQTIACFAILLLQEILKIPSIIVTKANQRSNNCKTFVLIETPRDIEDVLHSIESLKCKLLVDGNIIFQTDISKAVYYAFMSHYAFSLEYDKKFSDTWLSIEKFFLKWNVSKISSNVSIISSLIGMK